MLVLLHAIPPDGFCSSLLRRPHLPHGARLLRSLFNLWGGPTSQEDIQHRFPRCRLSATRSLCRLRRQRSLRGRFAPIRRSISILKPKTQTFLALLLPKPIRYKDRGIQVLLGNGIGLTFTEQNELILESVGFHFVLHHLRK